MTTPPNKLRVFLDADVIFAGSASPQEHSASHVVLLMGEITLLDCITSQQAITEVERNLGKKLSAKLPEFRLLVSRCLRVVDDPTLQELSSYQGQPDAKDLPLLASALREQANYFISFNVRHYFPTGNAIIMQRPGEFLRVIRQQLGQMGLAHWFDNVSGLHTYTPA